MRQDKAMPYFRPAISARKPAHRAPKKVPTERMETMSDVWESLGWKVSCLYNLLSALALCPGLRGRHAPVGHLLQPRNRPGIIAIQHTTKGGKGANHDSRPCRTLLLRRLLESKQSHLVCYIGNVNGTEREARKGGKERGEVQTRALINLAPTAREHAQKKACIDPRRRLSWAIWSLWGGVEDGSPAPPARELRGWARRR